MKPENASTPFATAAAVIGGMTVFAFLILAKQFGEGFAIPIGAMLTIGGVIVLRGPLGAAIAQRISGAQLPGGEPPPELLNELDELRHRVGELEERVDFSERLLAQQSREPASSPREGRHE